jgi:hypothetical protein
VVHPARLVASSLLLVLAAAGCSRSSTTSEAHRGDAAPAVAPPLPVEPTVAAPGLKTIRIAGMPHVRQRPDFCGEACLEMAAKRLGSKLDQNDAFAFTWLDPGLGRGAYTAELVDAATRMGFRTGDVWKHVDARAPAAGLDREFAALHADLARGVPSIVCMRWSDDPQPEHFRLVTGYDAERDEVVYQEPAEDAGSGRTMPRATFLSLWPLRYGTERWPVVRLALEPEPVGLAAPPPRLPGPSVAELSQHVMELRKRLPEGFQVRVERPFVVVGNGGPADLEHAARDIVRWSVQRLEKDFFARAPEKVLEVWLFKDKPSYQRGVKQLTGEEPSTPYGFYSPSHRMLLMNIATGGGTLVHEIVHPYVEADLPKAPAWINEGLGSLFEQSADRGGHIVGLTNWRLAGLQDAIVDRRLGSLEKMAHTTNDQFYGDDSGTHYAAARYLMYWLQEQSKLVAFVKALHTELDRDPSGWSTLVAHVGERDMAAFQKRWEAWVLELEFGGR